MIRQHIPSSLKSVIKHTRNTLLFSGNEKSCPVCERNWGSFAKTKFPDDVEAGCPWCGSQSRHRLVWHYFQKTLKIFEQNEPFSFLHIAPESCFTQTLRSRLSGRYITADLLADNVDVKMDITDIQYPAETFDFIYCSHVLEHVDDDRKAIAEFHRVLKSAAIAIIMVPVSDQLNETDEDIQVTDPQERLRRFGQEDHVRVYGNDIMQRLEAPRFLVQRIRPSDLLSDVQIERMGILKGSGDIFVCRK